MPAPNDYRIQPVDVSHYMQAYTAGREQKQREDVQYPLEKLQVAQARSKALSDLLAPIQDGDTYGFEMAKRRAIEEFKLPAEQVMSLTVADLPRLRKSSADTMAELDMLLKRAQIAKTQADTLTPEQQIALRRAGASNVTVNNAGERAFEKGVGEFQAKMFGEAAQTGLDAKGQLASIGVLRENMAKLPGGLASGLQGLASDWGLKIGPNAGAVEVASSIIANLVPAQRQPGSGQMSDRDVLLFKDSLPKLMNTPEGNAIILDTMEAMARFKQAQGNIASAAMTGEIGRAEATQMINNLPDPMASFRAYAKSGRIQGGNSVGTVKRAKAKDGRDIFLNPKTNEWEFGVPK